MYEQVLDPVGGSLFATALFAALPLITLFVLLGGLKFKASGSPAPAACSPSCPRSSAGSASP
jgi:hypothetical protein